MCFERLGQLMIGPVNIFITIGPDVVVPK
jgi:hypothetical protein